MVSSAKFIIKHLNDVWIMEGHQCQMNRPLPLWGQLQNSGRLWGCLRPWQSKDTPGPVSEASAKVKALRQNTKGLKSGITSFLQPHWWNWSNTAVFSWALFYYTWYYNWPGAVRYLTQVCLLREKPVQWCDPTTTTFFNHSWSVINSLMWLCRFFLIFLCQSNEIWF